MKRLLVGLLLTAISPAPTLAQNLKVVKATSQGWSGGAYGRGGCRYNIQLKYSEKVTFDSIYIYKTGYTLSTLPKVYNGTGGIYTDSIKHTYNISESESHSYTRNYNYDPDEDNYVKVKKTPPPPPPPPPPVRQYEGAALIVYHYKGEKAFLIVSSFTQLPSIAYP